MAPSKPKREPDATPPPRKGLGIFMDDTVTSESKASSFAKKATASLIPAAQWRECGDEERLKRVQIKEFAANNAHLSMRKMLETLTTHLPMNPSCQPRIDKIKTMLARKKELEFKVLVGFLGATGAGKTTLLNALIGCSNLLPSSAWRASTAVPVEVSYNRSSCKESLFRAEVVYIAKEEWSEELRKLFEDIHDSGADGDNEDDSERKERINKSFDKIKYVYPHIRSLARLGATSVQELLSHPDVRDVFGSTKAIAKPTKNLLSAAIRRYIDSGDHNEVSAHWPLVKLVKVFVKSSLLEPGIILVDLPGSLDSNTARSSIAEKYHKELSATCIVGDITRGISEKNAQELLEKFTKRNLQLDGMYDADSLTFVLSKADQGFDTTQYIKQYPELVDQVSEDTRLQWTLKGRSVDRERERSAEEKRLNENKKIIRELSKEVKDVTSRLNKFSGNSSPLLSTRKRGVDDSTMTSASAPAPREQMELRNKLAQLEKQLSDLSNTTQKQTKSLLSLSRAIGSLKRASFFARSRVLAQCFQHRNELSIAAVRSDYEATLQEMGRQPIKQLQVFPVSATLYLSYQSLNDGNKSAMGFPNREATQIPALRDWIMGTTLENRDKNAQAFLNEVDGFLDSTQLWIAGKYGDSKMSAELREHWEPQLDRMVVELEVNLRSLSINTSNSMKQLVETNIYSKVPEARKLAGAKAKRTGEKWAIGTHWYTYRVVNRERGVWTDSKGKDHKWNDELVHDFTSHVVRPWDLTFSRQFPNEKSSYVDGAKALITDFATAATDKNMCPDVADGLGMLKGRIIKTADVLRNQTDTAFDEMKKVVKKSHRQAAPAVREFLEDMYDHCASESGLGHYARSRKYIQETMKDDGVRMHRVGSNAIKAELDKLLDNIPVRLAAGYDLVLQQIRDEIQSFFEQHSSDGARNSTRKAASITKIRLNEALSADIKNLAKDWVTKPPTTAVEIPDDDETEDEMTLNEELFIDLDNGDDGDYEDGSDGDED